MAEPIIAIVSLVFVIIIALHSAIGHELAMIEVEQGQIEASQQVLETVNKTAEHLAQFPDEIYINDYTKNFVMWAGFGWFIIVLMIMNSKKNYIHGKEFGTSRWGTQNDIRDLFASTILAKEIKKAKQLKTKWGRRKAKKKALTECDKDGQIMLKQRLDEANKRERDRKKAHTSNKQLYKEEIAEIRKDVKAEVAKAKVQAWKPDRYKADCDEEIKEIQESNFLNDLEKANRIAEVKAKYKQRLKDFYDTSLQIELLKEKYSNADMIFTQTEKISFYNYVLNQNTLIIGGSGSGKTRGYVMPNVLQAHSSYIITDPKGEILEKAGYFLETVKGYKIRVLNLDAKKLSDGYNPFIYIHPEREGYEERVLSLIETIILNTDGDKQANSSDPFWPKAERLFLQAIFFFTVDGFVPEERNMSTVMRLIAMLEIAEDEDNFDSDLDYFAKMFEERFGEEHIGVQQFKEFRSKASGKTAKSIVISAVARLAPFRTSEVRRMFSYDSMELDRVGEEKTAIFVVTPPTDKSFNFIAGMLFTQLFQELQYCATQVHKHDGQRLPVPCRFILDEYANVAQIPNFVQILAYARSFGIGITVILQSLEQIKAMHEKEWGVIIDNCNSLLYLGSVTHEDTLKYISELLGKGTFDKRTTGRTRGRQGSSSENFDVVGRELMDASEIRRLPKTDCLLIVGGRHPFYSKKFNYESHPNYRLTSDGNHSLSYEYEPKPAPPKAERKVSHGEEKPKEKAPLVVPSADSVITVDGIKVEENQSLAENIKVMASTVRNFELLDNAMVVDDADYEAYLQEILAENEQTTVRATDALIAGSAVVASVVKEAESKVVVDPFVQGLSRLGRSFRTSTFVPVGFVGKEIDEMTEAEQTQLIKDAEAVVFTEEEVATTTDTALSNEFAQGLMDLGASLDSFDDEEGLDALLAGLNLDDEE